MGRNKKETLEGSMASVPSNMKAPAEAVSGQKRAGDDSQVSPAAKRSGKTALLPLPSPTAVSLPPPRKLLPPHQLILAPMVGGSELAFRLLARRHGAQLCYTPMICCDDFLKPGAGISLLERHDDDCPLVAHFAGNEPEKMLTVAREAERCSGVVAIDLNLGCPQRSARSGHFGAFLCDQVDRKLLLTIVSTLSRSLSVPFFCKIRLLDDLDETLEFVKQLQDAGCALLTVHGRYRGSPMRRRDGPAHLDQIREIKQKLSIPVITNGNVRNGSELIDALRITGADGAMSAEGALDDPAIFAKAIAHVNTERARLAGAVSQGRTLKKAKHEQGRTLSEDEKAIAKGRKAARARLAELPVLQPPPPLSSAVPMPPPREDGVVAGISTPPQPGPFDLAEQYIALVEKYPPPGGEDALLSHAIFHLRRLCRTPLTEFELLAALKACTSLQACAGVIKRCRAYADGTLAFGGNRRPPSYWRRQQRRGVVLKSKPESCAHHPEA